jgi:putative SOS response-associated peptidase YedK
MCYNIAIMETRQQKYAERYKDVIGATFSFETAQPELPLYYFVSGFAHPFLPIVRYDGLFLFEWGLIPSWIKDTKSASEIKTKTLNAVGETVFEKPSFRKSIAKQRCLLAVSGFYEWREINKKKYPYFIKTIQSEIFSLGCIYDIWTDKSTEELHHTFSILTTPANPLMEKIHNVKKRMPLIIAKEDEKKWVDPNISIDEIKSMIKPYNESDMTAHSISQTANSARVNRNVPEILNPVDYPELALFD